MFQEICLRAEQSKLSFWYVIHFDADGVFHSVVILEVSFHHPYPNYFSSSRQSLHFSSFNIFNASYKIIQVRCDCCCTSRIKEYLMSTFANIAAFRQIQVVFNIGYLPIVGKR